MSRLDDIGDRLGRLRRRRGLTQEQLAEASGVDVSTIRKLEQGVREGARLSTLRALANVLGAATSDLFGTSAPQPATDDEAGRLDLVSLRGALSPPVHLTPTGEAHDPEALDVAYRNVDALVRANRFDEAARALPSLIGDVRVADRPEMTCYVLHLAGTLLTHMRQYDLAYFALAEAVRVAREHGQELTAASAVQTLCWLFIRQGRLREAEDMAVATADAIEPKMSRAAPEQLSTWGWLALYGSSAAIRNNRADDAAALLRLARTAATNITAERHHPGWRVMTPYFDGVTVRRRRIENAVISQDYRGALAMAERLPTKGGQPGSVNRNRHLLDVAAAHVGQRSYTEGFDILREIHRDAPEWLAHQSYARHTLRTILDQRARPVTDEMREMADVLSVDG